MFERKLIVANVEDSFWLQITFKLQVVIVDLTCANSKCFSFHRDSCILHILHIYSNFPFFFFAEIMNDISQLNAY